MKLHELREAEGTKRPRKRRGRGIAAGQGKTAGFGTKGNGSRSGRGGNAYFEGGQKPLVVRLPIKRGFRNVNRIEYAVVNVAALNQFAADTVVDANMLINSGLIKRVNSLIKVLGEGELDRPLTVRVNKFSVAAREKIEAAGGKAEEVA